ncbi:acrosomal protein SP-10 [Notamacropus eugenii]|uniref:acrosomal protein SP-10 n=1 Tax=Notamacropus eugenii TaxID=9315 RepID=UPI003B671841
MSKLFLLGLFLLCLSGGGAIRCKQCSSYKKDTCQGGENHCILKNNESCMIKRTISPLDIGPPWESLESQKTQLEKMNGISHLSHNKYLMKLGRSRSGVLMDKFLLLGFVTLLCLMDALCGPYVKKPEAFPLRCNHCEPKKPCDDEINSCLAGPRQFCKTVKIYFSKSNYSSILTCARKCKPKNKTSHGFEVEILCCNDEDYCNVD